MLGYPAFIEMLNQSDPAVRKAIETLDAGKSPIDIKLENKEAKDSLVSKLGHSILPGEIAMPASYAEYGAGIVYV